MSRPAEACGGTFCDSGPRFMRVDQTGENILFVMEPGMVEAHIQIQYQGEASRFSWVLPVQALPDVQVGSEALFTRLLQATVPSFGYTTQRDACNQGGVTGGSGGSGPFPGPSLDASASADSGVNVVLSKTVGAFDVKVLEGRTTQAVLDWLATNGYQAPTSAPALLDGYVAKGYLFVAVKLTGGAGIDQIHPLVIRYAGTEPCVPLKLTAVAAVEDMGVRTFFLGTKRVVPKSFKHVVPNPVLLDWMRLGANYNDLVGRAVDSPIANGHGFVTEYAGPAAVVGTGLLASPKWNASAFSTIAAVDVVTQLQNQGLLFCSNYNGPRTTDGGFTTFGPGCSYSHPLVLPLLREYLPAPSTLTVRLDAGTGSTLTDPVAIEGTFYNCLSCYQDLIDPMKWDAGAFASALSSRIIEPARHGDALLAAWPYLTRMFTTISPLEMTADPEFWEHDGLPDVRVSGNGVRRITCTGASGMTLPDGRPVALTPQSTWPGFGLNMPFAERIEEFSATGSPIVLVDNTEKINGLLKAWNDSQGWPPKNIGGTTGSGSGGAGGVSATGGAGGIGATGGVNTTGVAGTSVASGTGAGGASAANDASNPATGCACRTTTSSSSMPWSLALGLAALAMRRRRSHE
jgi:MYXO-CTERM domain-containing protein